MNISKVIEQIRQKPEHIRLRYTYILTAISAVFIILIWLVSMKAAQDVRKEEPSQGDSGEIFETLGEQKESLKGAAQEMKGVFENAKQLKNLGQ